MVCVRMLALSGQAVEAVPEATTASYKIKGAWPVRIGILDSLIRYVVKDGNAAKNMWFY